MAMACRRVIVYHQTHFRSNGEYVSLEPLIDHLIPITHLIVAAIHLNEIPGDITVNDDPPNVSRNNKLWSELRRLQGLGVGVLGMLGGAAQGSFRRLDGDRQSFDAYYQPLKEMLTRYHFDGLDLDVEEEMSIEGIVRLIDQLRRDFGRDFIITLAPVAGALMDDGWHLSGFDYKELESRRGHEIAWYNTQFYNGWGHMHSTLCFDAILRSEWPPGRIVAGVLTNPRNGTAAYDSLDSLRRIITLLVNKYGDIGGVFGWEYFNSIPRRDCDESCPWVWFETIFQILWEIVD